jgi:glucose-6-phosphate 1-epimerase
MEEVPMPDGVRWETGAGGLSFLIVDTPRCRARITPYGGQLCEWTPAGHDVPAIFLSPRAAFVPGRPIRGGVPICFPWFGNHATDRGKPAHGFARTRTWEVGEVATDGIGDLRVTLYLASDELTRALWEASFKATLTALLGDSLTLALEVENTGPAEITYETALHAYLGVGDVQQIRVHGLERTRFIDKVDAGREKVTADGPLVLTAETDRVFLDTPGPCIVDDPVIGRQLRIRKWGSGATVVWNPWRDKGSALADVGADAWSRFVCVEPASCGPHAVTLSPGTRHVTAMRIDVGLLA